LEIGEPTHTTILNWTKKQGVGNFKTVEYFNQQKWVLIVDESIQFGNKKLLFITAVPEDKEFGKGYLIYSDLTPLVLQVSSSWKSEDIANAIKESIDIKQIAYVVSDMGSNLVKAFKSLDITHIEDINHKFSWMMQQIFENNEVYKTYAKSLSDMRTKLSLSKTSRFLPPNQRVISRYMNLTPLFEWGVNMLKLLETEYLTDEEKEKLSFLPAYKEFILHTNALLQNLNQIQQIMKNSGFSKKTTKMSIKLLDTLTDVNSLKIKEMVIAYFNNTELKMEKYDTILCSSDIVESCFGKYKELVKTNKTVGISDLSLCISAMMGYSLEDLKANFERLKTKDVTEWKEKYIGKTLFSEKIELLKNVKCEKT